MTRAAPAELSTTDASKGVSGLAPTYGLGGVHLAATCLASGGGVLTAAQEGWGLWLLGQVLLALAGLRWFLILHEASHGTLLPGRVGNKVAARVAGVWSGIPSGAWRRVHAGHHRWTGWDDRDPTRAGLAASPPRGALGLLLALAWRTGFPLIALLYRRAFWREARVWEASGVAVVWLGALVGLGPGWLLVHFGPGLLLGLVLQEQVILSQHTHLPQERAGAQRVRPFSAAAQGRFTRSLETPRWLSWLLLGAEAHSLHHRFPQVPGYRLRELADLGQRHQPRWLTWLWSARRHSAQSYLFSTHEGCASCQPLTSARTP